MNTEYERRKIELSAKNELDTGCIRSIIRGKPHSNQPGVVGLAIEIATNEVPAKINNVSIDVLPAFQSQYRRKIYTIGKTAISKFPIGIPKLSKEDASRLEKIIFLKADEKINGT